MVLVLINLNFINYKMLILKRPPGDTFTFRLFYKLVSTINTQCNSIYVWSTALEPYYFNKNKSHSNGDISEYETEAHLRKYIQNSINKDTIVIGVKDHLTAREFNPWLENMPSTVQYLDNFFNFYSNKKIILLTSVEGLENYINRPNVTIVPWGGDITNHSTEYKALTPIKSKNFDSNYNYISLNRNIRNHRKILVSLLFGLNLQKTGLISCMFKDSFSHIKDIAQDTKWEFNKTQRHIKDIVHKGIELVKDYQLPLDDDTNIYVDGNNDNVSNFKNKLSSYYENSFVELISETSYTEKCYLLTEKTLNSIYGMNFPILITSQGAVSLLRKMGMDMFDDVIDHSYDDIENPIDRLYFAIEKNKKVLIDQEYIKQKWRECEPRFKKNVEWGKTTLYNFYEERATELFKML